MTTSTPPIFAPSTPPVPPASIPAGPRYEVPIDLLATARRIYRAWPLLFGTTLAGTLIGLLMVFLTKPFYIAQAVFLPPRNTEVLSAGASALFNTADSSDTFLGLLQSRTLQDDVIAHLNLMQVYHAKLHADAESSLASASTFSISKNSLITVSIKSGDAKLAAEIANTYLEALYRLDGQMLESGSIHRREFLEQQVDEERKSMLQAENDLKQTQERTGINLPAGEAQQALLNTATLQGQINLARARLAGLLSSDTESNPEVKAARNEIDQLQAELAQQDSAATGAGIASTRKIPALSLELAQKTREVTLRENVYQALVQQYERARLAAIDPGSQLQIVDLAVVPERKAGPGRRLYVIVGFSLGLFAGFLYLFGYAPLRRFLHILRQPETPGTV